jgi:hypothetical protein
LSLPDQTDKRAELIAKYPRLFSQTQYLEFDDGWLDLVASICYTINSHEKALEQKWKENVDYVVFQQLKQKFGVLRVYYMGGDEYIHGAVRMAENYSSKVCEMCGSPAQVVNLLVGRSTKTRWIKVLCEKCEKKYLGDQND